MKQLLLALLLVASALTAPGIADEHRSKKPKHKAANQDLQTKQIQELEALMETHLDAAIAARKEIREKKAAAARASLKSQLSDSRWQWEGKNSEAITFQADGIVRQKGWERRGLKTVWEVIDSHTVLLRIASGRKIHIYAILRFDADLEQFTGHNFGGGGVGVNRKVKK